MQLGEARFTSIENNITAPEVTPIISKWLKEMRKSHDLPDRADSFRDLIDREHALLLGELQMGRKRVRIWVQNIDVDGYWVERPKRSSYVLISADLVVNNPQRALSTIVHELIHGIQQYRAQSDAYNIAAAKTEDETEEEMFHYYTEPKEIEAQLGQLGHEVVEVYRRKRNKQEMIQTLEHVLRLPRAAFQSADWVKHSPHMNMFKGFQRLLQSISMPPQSLQNSLRAQQKSNKCWRQFKQKLFNLVQMLKHN